MFQHSYMHIFNSKRLETSKKNTLGVLLRSIHHVKQRLAIDADRCTVNSELLIRIETEGLVTDGLIIGSDAAGT